jgi:hypothetical protein
MVDRYSVVKREPLILEAALSVTRTRGCAIVNTMRHWPVPQGWGGGRGRRKCMTELGGSCLEFLFGVAPVSSLGGEDAGWLTKNTSLHLIEI